MNVPQIRITTLRDNIRPKADFVLYWMTTNRRLEWNFGLDRSLEICRELEKPLVILEALRCDYPWVSERLHKFVIEGMREHAMQCQGHANVIYYPFVETEKGQGKGLLSSLAENACAILSDEFPCFFLPKMINAALKQTKCHFESIDSNGLLPMRAAKGKTFTLAHSFRRFLQKTLKPHLQEFPASHPLKDFAQASKCKASKSLRRWLTQKQQRWPAETQENLKNFDLSGLPIDHKVAAGSCVGGRKEAAARLKTFLEKRLKHYVKQRNHPDTSGSSELSAYLHFGHISAHEIFAKLVELEQWTPSDLAAKAHGKRHGWWSMSESAEAFLDELITWREIGYNMCFLNDDYADLSSLPKWAQTTIEEHKSDARPYLYSLQDFENGKTHDDVWNAAQRELVKTGRMHNYLRMLWGKKIYHYSPDAQSSLEILIELNNKYALDGRNPNSYSGIFWVLGRYDRAWGPERQVFGKLRFMTSESTKKKIQMKAYLAQYSQENKS